jgi:hypothetical protein
MRNSFLTILVVSAPGAVNGQNASKRICKLFAPAVQPKLSWDALRKGQLRSARKTAKITQDVYLHVHQDVETPPRFWAAFQNFCRRLFIRME